MLIVFQIGFVFLTACAAVTDYRHMKIPNWVSLALCALFAVYAFRLPTWSTIGWHTAIGLGVFAGGVVSYSVGLFGAGDVKFLGALALWAGPEQIVGFLVLTSLLGGAFGLLILGVSKLNAFFPAYIERPNEVWNITRWAHSGTCPYGIPIAVAALLSIPKIFLA